MTMDHEAVTAGVRAWAKGMYTTEAAVELLIRGGRAIYPGAPWLTVREDGKVALDFDKLYDEAGVWSGGEQRIVRIAMGLVDNERPVQLGDDVAALDRVHVSLVLAAIAHASGSHEHGGFRYDENGKPVGTIKHETLYAWPQN